ncbi:MAG: hypothetical protein ACI9UO_001371 [Nitrospinales bacterium]
MSKGSFRPAFLMQENTESEKPADSDTPEKEKNSSDVEETAEIPESSEDESPFEEQEGEVLPTEKKNKSGCGFLIFILLILTSGVGYLYYTHQIPSQIMQWIEPLIGSQPKQYNQIARPPVVSPSEKSPVTLEEKTVFEESLSVEEEPSIKIVSPPPLEEIEHISGSLAKLISEPIDNPYSAKISGSSTTVVEPNVEVVVEESKAQEGLSEREPVFSPSPPKPLEPVQPEKGQRNEAVQAYLDFFESALVKIGELIKTGFAKGKDFLMQSFG